MAKISWGFALKSLKTEFSVPKFCEELPMWFRISFILDPARLQHMSFMLFSYTACFSAWITLIGAFQHLVADNHKCSWLQIFVSLKFSWSVTLFMSKSSSKNNNVNNTHLSIRSLMNGLDKIVRSSHFWTRQMISRDLIKPQDQLSSIG